jgi:hypothetical protein
VHVIAWISVFCRSRSLPLSICCPSCLAPNFPSSYAVSTINFIRCRSSCGRCHVVAVQITSICSPASMSWLAMKNRDLPRMSRGHGLISPDIRSPALDPHAQRANMFAPATFISPPAGSGRVIFNRSTNKNHSFSHPEIELRPSIFGSLSGISKASTKTILGLLEVYPDHVNWKERLGHSSLLKCFQVGSL